MEVAFCIFAVLSIVLAAAVAFLDSEVRAWMRLHKTMQEIVALKNETIRLQNERLAHYEQSQEPSLLEQS